MIPNIAKTGHVSNFPDWLSIAFHLSNSQCFDCNVGHKPYGKLERFTCTSLGPHVIACIG